MLWALMLIYLIAVLAGTLYIIGQMPNSRKLAYENIKNAAPALWVAPGTYTLPADENGRLIRYGKELIANTSHYLGPKGAVAQITNGMNCQNCHLDAGTRAWGNNYGAVAATYPKYRARSGSIESVLKRVNDCFVRSLNGTPPDSNSKESKAIVAYIQWLGAAAEKGKKPHGSGIKELPFLNRAASAEKGEAVYAAKCLSCHGAGGQGVLAPTGDAYQYPPLWGPHSYNTGAGLFRLSRFAGYVYDNMPYRTIFDNKPQLTNEEAWDVAAYVNTQTRPHADIRNDWPDITEKPFDNPIGPYADTFSEAQHKYGPFKPIKDAAKKLPKKHS